MSYKYVLQPILGYKEFFEKELPPDHFMLLEKYPTDVLLLVLCKINAALFQTGLEENAVQQLIFREIFQNLSDTTRKRVVNLIVRGQTKEEEKNIFFFNSQSVTWLITECFKRYKPVDESIPVNTVQLENDVFESILIANGYFFNENIDGTLNSYETVWKLSLRQQNYMRNIVWMMQQGSIKMLLLRKFIIGHFPAGIKYINEFKEKLGMHYFFGYSSIFMNVIAGVFNGYRETQQIQWHLEITPDAEKLIEFVSLRPKDFIDRGNSPTLHGSVVPKPFYYLADKIPVIIDFNFLPFLIDTCLPYNFYAWTSIGKDSGLDNFIKFKNQLGKSYYEEYVMSLLLFKLFPKALIYHGNQINEITDYIMVKGNDIFLFEVKSNSIHYNIMESMNVDQFRSFLDATFLSSKSENRKDKGVHQLAKCIKRLSKSWPSAMQNRMRNHKHYTVYPIIVYTENVLDAAGVNRYCAETFEQSEHLKDTEFKSIKPLVMMNQNFLILQYAGMKKDKSLLKKTILDYIARIKSGISSFKKSNDPYVFLNSCLSFDQFARQTLQDPPYNIRVITDDLDLNEPAITR